MISRLNYGDQLAGTPDGSVFCEGFNYFEFFMAEKINNFIQRIQSQKMRYLESEVRSPY